jgi:hypothetical protein
MNAIPVREFMQRDPVTAKPEMSLIELVALMRRDARRGLPVTDDDNRLVGVITENDLFLKEHPLPFSTEKVPSLLGQVIDKGPAGSGVESRTGNDPERSHRSGRHDARGHRVAHAREAPHDGSRRCRRLAGWSRATQ